MLEYTQTYLQVYISNNICKLIVNNQAEPAANQDSNSNNVNKKKTAILMVSGMHWCNEHIWGTGSHQTKDWCPAACTKKIED